MARPRRRLGELGHDERAVAQVLAVLEAGLRGLARRVVAAEAVVKQRLRVGRHIDHPAEPARGRRPHHGLDQLGGDRLLSTPRRELHLLITDRRVAHRLRDRALFLHHDGDLGQLSRGQLAAGVEVERELQLHERAALARHPHLARGQLVPGPGVPQLDRDQPGRPRAGQPQPATETEIAHRRLEREHSLQRLPERRLGHRVALGEPKREGVEDNVHGAGVAGRGRCGAGRFGGLHHAVRVGDPDGRAERLKVRVPGMRGVQRLQPLGGAAEQPRGVGDAALVERDLSAHVLDLGDLCGRQRPGLRRGQQLQRGFERAGVALRPRGGKQAAHALGGAGRERRRVSEAGRRRDASARVRARGRALQLRGDRLVRPGSGLGAMPRAPVGIGRGVGRLGERRVQ